MGALTYRNWSSTTNYTKQSSAVIESSWLHRSDCLQKQKLPAVDLYELLKLMWPKTYHFLFPLVLSFLRVQLLQQVPHFGIQFFVAVLQLLNWHLIKSKRDPIIRKYIHTGLQSPLAFDQCTNSGGVRSRDGPHWTYGITFGTGIGYSWMLSSHLALLKYVQRIFWASGHGSGLKADWHLWLVDPSCTWGGSSGAMPFLSYSSPSCFPSPHPYFSSLPHFFPPQCYG